MIKIHKKFNSFFDELSVKHTIVKINMVDFWIYNAFNDIIEVFFLFFFFKNSMNISMKFHLCDMKS